MLDTLQIIFWSITYILVIVAGFFSRDEKKVSMPYIPSVLNFTWEICGLYVSKGFWGHIAWVGLDIAIVFWGFRYAKNNMNRILYGISILLSTLCFMYIFTLEQGMLISSFVIDLIMAVCFLVDRKKLSPKLKVAIAVTKLIGDTFAGIYYTRYSIIIWIISGVVFFCNLFYLNLCVQERKVRPNNDSATAAVWKAC